VTSAVIEKYGYKNFLILQHNFFDFSDATLKHINDFGRILLYITRKLSFKNKISVGHISTLKL
jgi:hypothetical protein